MLAASTNIPATTDGGGGEKEELDALPEEVCADRKTLFRDEGLSPEGRAEKVGGS